MFAAPCRARKDRASSSLDEGSHCSLPSDSAGVLRRHFEIANNSLHEVVGAVDLADTLGVVEGGVAAGILSLAVRIKRMLRALPR